MGIVGLGGTQKSDTQNKEESLIDNTEPKIEYNANWYNENCNKCPYFVDDEVNQIRHCVRPFGESCLTESILVGNLLIKEKFERIAILMKNSVMPKISKKIKRKR